MEKRIFRNRFLVAVCICFMLALSCQEAFARGGREDGRGSGREGRHEGGRYHYRDGKWHKSGWFGIEVAVAALAVGAIVASLPRERKVVVVEGAPRYYYDGYYYRACPSGYVVVPSPINTKVVYAASAPQPVELYAQTVVINVPNSNGSYTPVNMVKNGNGYTGPQGEFYPYTPTVDQLRALYGK